MVEEFKGKMSVHDVTHLDIVGCADDGSALIVGLEVGGKVHRFAIPPRMADAMVDGLLTYGGKAEELRNKGKPLSARGALTYHATTVGLTPSFDRTVARMKFSDGGSVHRTIDVPAQIAKRLGQGLLQQFPPDGSLPGLPTKSRHH
jgi:hypothetical protein